MPLSNGNQERGRQGELGTTVCVGHKKLGILHQNGIGLIHSPGHNHTELLCTAIVLSFKKLILKQPNAIRLPAFPSFLREIRLNLDEVKE